MNFKTFYNEAVRVIHIDPEEDWDMAEEAEQIMKKVKIRPDSRKNLSLVAIDNDVVVGAMYTSWAPGSEEVDGHRVTEFAWDIGVDPKYQGQNVGRQLIDAVMKLYQQEKHSYDDYTRVRLWVVNPRLADYLERQYGFEGDDVGGGQKMMYKY